MQHFTHPHILIKEVSDQNLGEGYRNGEFICDACNTIGSGIRYHCKPCQFDLHEDCATCPHEYPNSYFHPEHKLTLVWEGPDLVKKNHYGVFRPCNVCGDQVNGLFYKCSSGERCFFIHPLCSKFPSKVPHLIDNIHPLTFQSAPIIPDSACRICGNLVCASSWSYRCDPCGINIHLECVTLPYSGASGSSRSPGYPHQQMTQERRPTESPDQSYNYHPSNQNNNGGITGAVPLAHSFNHHPSGHNNNYPPASSSTGMPLLHYHHYYPPNNAPPSGPTSSTTGGNKRMYAIVGRIVMGLIFAATLGVPLITE